LIKYNKESEFRLRTSRGYTMLELMVVSSIISILAAMSFALLSRTRVQAIETAAMSGLNTIATAYEMYYFFNKEYPQWGQNQRFSSPEDLWDHLVSEDFLPHSYKNVDFDADTGYIYGFTDDYAVEIVPFDELDPTTSQKGSYFIVFHPYNFQRDALAIGLNPPTGWVAVRTRRGQNAEDYRSFHLYVFKRGGAVD